MLDRDSGTVVLPVGLKVCVVWCCVVGIRCVALGAASCRSGRLGGGRCFNELLGGEDGSCSPTFPTA